MYLSHARLCGRIQNHSTVADYATNWNFIDPLLFNSVSKGNFQITLKVEKVSLKEVFNQIHEQSGYDIFYNGELIRNAGPVTVNLNNVSIRQALEACLADKQLTYTISEKTVVIKEKIIVAQRFLAPPPLTIKGTVKGSDGKPLANVNVVVKNTNRGVVTDASGQFTMEVEPRSTLVISSIGYNSQEIKISETQTYLNISMAIATSPLDDNTNYRIWH